MPTFRDRLMLAAISTLAVAMFVVVTVTAQAPAAPRQGAPAAPQAAGRGAGALPGTESGWSTVQGQCVGCHGVVTQIGTAPMVASLRQMTPERIYSALQGKPHHDRTLTDIQAQRVAEFMGGRPLGSTDHGDAKDMANRCTANMLIDSSATRSGSPVSCHNHSIASSDVSGSDASKPPQPG